MKLREIIIILLGVVIALDSWSVEMSQRQNSNLDGISVSKVLLAKLELSKFKTYDRY